MFNLIAARKEIELLDCPTLENIGNYNRPLVPRKFFRFPVENSIGAIYEDNKIHLLKVFLNDNGQNIIQQYKKLKVEGVTCGEVAHRNGNNEMAIGLSNGTINFIDCNTMEVMTKTYKCDTFGEGVYNVNFNHDATLLASTFENGELYIFNLKNSQRQKHKLDLKSDIIRFHPNKSDLLAITSLSGGLTVINVNIKNPMYSDPSFHKMYSSDISWSPSSANILVSVGSDCLMKVFDFRQKLLLEERKHKYPFSSLAISQCGNYCCTGDMKGSICAYDFRNLKTSLYVNEQDASNVSKLSFLPHSLVSLEESDSVFEMLHDSDECDQNEQYAIKRRDSLKDFFDKVKPRVLSTRESRRESRDRRSLESFYSKVLPKLSHHKTNMEIKTPDCLPEEEDIIDNETPTDPNNQSQAPLQRDNILIKQAQVNDKLKRRTLIPSEMHPIGESLKSMVLTENSSSNRYSSDNKENHTQSPLSNQKLSATRCNNTLCVMQMEEMSEKIQNLETKFDTMYERIIKLDKKMDDQSENLNEQMKQNFFLTHCAIWDSENILLQMKDKVDSMHQILHNVEAVFIENSNLKEKLNKMHRSYDEEN